MNFFLFLFFLAIIVLLLTLILLVLFYAKEPFGQLHYNTMTIWIDYIFDFIINNIIMYIYA